MPEQGKFTGYLVPKPLHIWTVASKPTVLTLVLPILTPMHFSWPLPTMLPRPLSSPHQPVEQRPRQHKTHTAIQHISGPQLAPGSLEIVPLPALCQYAPDEYGDEEGAEEVEEETGVGLEAKDSGGDAEEGGGEGADVGDYLGVKSQRFEGFWKWVCQRHMWSCHTWVLCWTDSGTIGDIASSRSVGMAGLVELEGQ